MEDLLGLEPLLDEVADRLARKDWTARPFDAIRGETPLAGAVLLVLRDRTLRVEHRRRIYEDIVAHRKYLLRTSDPRVVDLMVWGEHVEKLHKSFGSRRLQEAEFRRAILATARKCEYDVHGLAGDVDKLTLLGVAWASRHYGVTHGFLLEVSADVDEPEAPREAASQP